MMQGALGLVVDHPWVGCRVCHSAQSWGGFIRLGEGPIVGIVFS